MDTALALIGGLGLGTLITSFVNSWLEGRKERANRIFNEKRDAYMGLLSAIRDAPLVENERGSREVALWKMRVYLVGAPKVCTALDEVVATSGKPEMHQSHVHAWNLMADSMREDLSIDCRRLENARR